MDWIEWIQVRTYTPSDRDEALAAFHELAFPDREKGLEDITLFRDFTPTNDMCIFIAWNGPVPEKGKSPLGLQLAATFSEFGRIYHSVWTFDARLTLKPRRKLHATKKAV